MKAASDRQQKRTTDNAQKLAETSVEGQHQNEFAAHQAPSAMIAMRNEMEDAISELRVESRELADIAKAKQLLLNAARLLSDAQAMMETHNREMRAWAGVPASQQWAAMRLDRPVEHPDLPTPPRAAVAMFGPLTEPNGNVGFTFRSQAIP
jgi:hypothetical protein